MVGWCYNVLKSANDYKAPSRSRSGHTHSSGVSYNLTSGKLHTPVPLLTTIKPLLKNLWMHNYSTATSFTLL
eukprot:1911284-Pyramimonas_sp.AAC.2